MKDRMTSLVKGTLTAWPPAPLLRLLGFVPLLAVTMAAGPCGKEPLGSVDGGPSCTYQGKVYHPGTTFLAADGCNSCSCGTDGFVGCTLKACLDGGADGSDGSFADSGSKCFDPLTGVEISCDAGIPSDAGRTCFDANGQVIPCPGDGGVDMCTYLGKVYPVGASFPDADNCNRCNCASGGQVSCGHATCVDAGADVPPGTCTYAGKVYPDGSTFLASDGCNTCSCSTSGLVACTTMGCQDGGKPTDTGAIPGVCTPGQDSTCNEDPFVSTLRGKCLPDGSCSCAGSGTSGVVSPYTGKCLGIDNMTGNGCEYQKTYPVGSSFQCGDSSCTVCICEAPGKITAKSMCADAGTATCGLDAIYVYGDIGGLRLYQDQVTIAPSPTSPRDLATYVRTRNNVDGTAGVSCAPPFPACGDTTAVDVSDIMADIQDPVVQKYLTSDPSKTPFLGFDTRPIDGTAFSFMRGDGHGFLVGQACGTSSSASSCFAIPPTIDKLVKDLRALDEQQLRAASCAALR